MKSLQLTFVKTFELFRYKKEILFVVLVLPMMNSLIFASYLPRIRLFLREGITTRMQDVVILSGMFQRNLQFVGNH